MYSISSQRNKTINEQEKLQNTNSWRLNSTLINNEKVLDESQQKMKAFLELNGHEKAADQSLWNTTKAVLWEVYSLNSYIKKPEKA